MTNLLALPTYMWSFSKGNVPLVCILPLVVCLALETNRDVECVPRVHSLVHNCQQVLIYVILLLKMPLVCILPPVCPYGLACQPCPNDSLGYRMCCWGHFWFIIAATVNQHPPLHHEG